MLTHLLPCQSIPPIHFVGKKNEPCTGIYVTCKSIKDFRKNVNGKSLSAMRWIHSELCRPGVERRWLILAGFSICLKRFLKTFEWIFKQLSVESLNCMWKEAVRDRCTGVSGLFVFVFPLEEIFHVLSTYDQWSLKWHTRLYFLPHGLIFLNMPFSLTSPISPFWEIIQFP